MKCSLCIGVFFLFGRVNCGSIMCRFLVWEFFMGGMNSVLLRFVGFLFSVKLGVLVVYFSSVFVGLWI